MHLPWGIVFILAITEVRFLAYCLPQHSHLTHDRNVVINEAILLSSKQTCKNICQSFED